MRPPAAKRAARLNTPHPSLGLAAADLLLEIGPDGRVDAALGSAPTLLGAPCEALLTRAWRSLIDPEDQPLVAALFAGLEDTVRAGPLLVRLAGGNRAALSAIRRDGRAGAIACALVAVEPLRASHLRRHEDLKRREAALGDAGPLAATIRDRRFTLAYQPVVALADGALHHHEVLVRFGSEGSPFPTIRMAEELDLIAPLDLAVLEEALLVLQATPDLVLAVNASGRSLMSEAFVSAALRLLQAAPGTKGRLMFELTESAAVEDLSLADRHLQALRAAGCEVCLDDFGAGAASLAYLQQLTLDLVKIDGRYIRDLQHGGREATFVRHLVNMCGELRVRTLAEMVETPEAEDAVRRAGVDYAQGWLYGRAAPRPLDPHWTVRKIRA